MIADTLGTNKSLPVGSTLTSANGSTVLTMQPDGNLVLTANGQTLSISGTSGKPVTNAWINWDGNLHVSDGANKIYWSNGASGHKDSFLKV